MQTQSASQLISVLLAMGLSAFYMPKCKQNYTTGIKVPWTLHSQENWNRTHRLAGWIWIIGGVAMIVNSFLQLEWILFLTIAALVLIPIGYSFLLFKKGI